MSKFQQRYKQRRILFLTNVPSPYRVDFFNELGKRCDLTVLFEKNTSDERDESWRQYQFTSFSGVFLNGKSINTDTAICPAVLHYVRDRSYDKIIVADYSSPTGIMAILYMKAHSIPYWVEGDGGFPKSGRGLKERFKCFLIAGAKGWFSTSAEHDKYYLQYGARPSGIVRYPFTSLFEKDILLTPCTPIEKKSIREELGLKEDKIIISVGRFSYQNGYGKGYDILLKICEGLPKNFGVYIIGDQPTEAFSKWKKDKELGQLHFLEFKKKDELFKYYKAADLFTLLTRGEAWGLVINEAMANGLPVVTTDRCIAGLELVRNGENGYIVPAGDVEAAADAIRKALDSDTEEMGKRSLEIIREYTIEKMADAHVEAFYRKNEKD